MDKIILSGYMGSGKSTIASLLHNKLDLSLIELDALIESKAGVAIPEIFDTRGEIFFRKLEHKTLKEVLSQRENFVLSLGGGTPCYANNHELLKADNINWIYLKASPETLYKRITADKTIRPLLAGKSAGELQSFIAQHVFERSYFYSQAKYKVDTDGKTPDEIVDEISELIERN